MRRGRTLQKVTRGIRTPLVGTAPLRKIIGSIVAPQALPDEPRLRQEPLRVRSGGFRLRDTLPGDRLTPRSASLTDRRARTGGREHGRVVRAFGHGLAGGGRSGPPRRRLRRARRGPAARARAFSRGP